MAAMLRNPKKLCRRFGLIYVDTKDLQFQRRRCGKGFAYFDSENRTIRDNAVKARINQLAIPPAWTEVCIAEDERAHIQAVGRDAEGRLQYRYHPAWDEARSLTKANRLLRLGSALPRLRDRDGLKKIETALMRLLERRRTG